MRNWFGTKLLLVEILGNVFYTATAVLDRLEWLCSFAWQKMILRKCNIMVEVDVCVHLWL